MRGQVASADTVISLSVLAAMVAMWVQMYLGFSPIYQIYTYVATLRASDHVINTLLFFPNASWACKTPENIFVPGCVKTGTSISPSDLGADDLNMNVYVDCLGIGSSPSGSAPKVVRNVRICVGPDWNTCTWQNCKVEVQHR